MKIGKNRFLTRLKGIEKWKPPSDWKKVKTIEMHTAGEPLRVFLSGYPELRGNTVLAKRRLAKEKYDHLRTALMWEPRGHADMYGCIVSFPTRKDADFDVLFLHNEGYSTMCGHAIIAVTKLAVELSLVEKSTPVTNLSINTPAGLVSAYAKIDKLGNVESVYFHNVPSFVVALDAEIYIPELGNVKYDLAFGGAFYVYVKASEFELECTPKHFDELIYKGMLVKNALRSADIVKHPFEDDLSFLYGTIFIGDPLEGGDSRNVCVFAKGEVDRSPTGTGVSGRMAIEFARGKIGLGQPMIIESILGTKFTGSVVGKVACGPHNAVIPKVEGVSHITGRSEFFIDPDDPLNKGFILR